jgi:hypothetical protein
MVTIADVDGDNRAEIVSPLNDSQGGAFRGIRVWGDRNDNWVNTRRIWNQHAYHVGNVLDDGRVAPAVGGTCEERPWLTHGTWRSQLLGTASPLALPDLTLTVTGSRLDLSDPCNPLQVVEGRVGNGGALSSSAPSDVVVYRGDPAGGGRAVGLVTMPAIEPGEWAPFSVSVQVRGSGELFVLADDDGTGTGTGLVSECREDNNACVVPVDPGAPGFPAEVGSVLFATGHGDPLAPDVLGSFDWSGDEGRPRPAGEHYHLLRATRPDALVPVPGSEPWTDTSWDDVTPRSGTLPVCHYLRVVAADACEQEELAP